MSYKLLDDGKHVQSKTSFKCYEISRIPDGKPVANLRRLAPLLCEVGTYKLILTNHQYDVKTRDVSVSRLAATEVHASSARMPMVKRACLHLGEFMRWSSADAYSGGRADGRARMLTNYKRFQDCY